MVEVFGNVVNSAQLWRTVRVAIRSKHGTKRLAALLMVLVVGSALVLAALTLLLHVAGPAASGVVGPIVEGVLEQSAPPQEGGPSG